MTTLSALTIIASGAMGVFMTFVSCRVLKLCPMLNNPLIHMLVGTLTFVGFIYRPGGIAGTICLSYESVAISILFLLLFSGGARKIRNIQNTRKRRTQDLGEYRSETSRNADPANIRLNQFKKQQNERRQ